MSSRNSQEQSSGKVVRTSQKVTTSNEKSKRDKLVGKAESLIGSRYHYGGNSPKEGFDCSGFTCFVMRSEAIDLPRTSADQSRTGKRKRLSMARKGDLVFFGHGNRVTHVGIVAIHTQGRLEVIHSTSSRGVVRDDILGSDYWRSRVLWVVDFSELY